MKVIRSIYDFNPGKRTTVTIGTFDGVHIGHQKILRNLIKDAAKEGGESVLLTFFPHPRMVLQKEVTISLLNTIEEKSSLLEEIGLDYLVIHAFSKNFSRLTAQDFVKSILVNQLNVAKLIIGHDHHFGKNREGNIDQLTRYGQLYDFKVEQICSQDIDHVSVSSTKIRKSLKEGDLKRANKYLGYPYMICGTVVEGKKLGKKIGFPTANISIDESYKLIPKTGVYVIRVIVEDELLYGMMNIGFNPTVSGKQQTIEAHLFDFDKNLYKKKIKIGLLHFLREEKKFKSIKELMVQLRMDKKNSISYLSDNPTQSHF